MNELNQGDELKIDFDCTQATEALPNGLQKMDIQLQTMSNLMMHHGRLLFKRHKIYSYKVDKQIFEDRKLSKFNYRCD